LPRSYKPIPHYRRTYRGRLRRSSEPWVYVVVDGPVSQIRRIAHNQLLAILERVEIDFEQILGLPAKYDCLAVERVYPYFKETKFA
jgi:hypothetical protein